MRQLSHLLPFSWSRTLDAPFLENTNQPRESAADSELLRVPLKMRSYLTSPIHTLNLQDTVVVILQHCEEVIFDLGVKHKAILRISSSQNLLLCLHSHKSTVEVAVHAILEHTSLSQDYFQLKALKSSKERLSLNSPYLPTDRSSQRNSEVINPLPRSFISVGLTTAEETRSQPHTQTNFVSNSQYPSPSPPILLRARSSF